MNVRQGPEKRFLHKIDGMQQSGQSPEMSWPKPALVHSLEKFIHGLPCPAQGRRRASQPLAPFVQLALGLFPGFAIAVLYQPHHLVAVALGLCPHIIRSLGPAGTSFRELAI